MVCRVCRTLRPAVEHPPFGFALVLVLVLTAAFSGEPALAQGCGADWDRPVVCAVELSGALEGSRRTVSLDGRSVELPTRSRVELYADPYDQWGRRFPPERFELRVDVDRSCEELLSIEREEPEYGRGDRLVLETGSRTGACEVLFWVPGNLNLDRPLRIEVSRDRSGGYTRSEAELLARWLFQAVLAREPDADGLRASTFEIQAGQIRSQVEAMVRSPEFQKRRAGLPADELLEDAYRGLLGRAPDTAGVRTYLPRVRRGDLAGVVLTLLGSEELETRLDRALE